MDWKKREEGGREKGENKKMLSEKIKEQRWRRGRSSSVGRIEKYKEGGEKIMKDFLKRKREGESNQTERERRKKVT